MKRYIIIVVVLLLSVSGLYLRTKWRSNHPISGDENYQISVINTLKSSISHAKHNVQFAGNNVLIYPFYKMFGKNKWGLAIPHILITLLGFYLLFRLCDKYFKTIWGYLITFSVFAFNYNLIYYAFTIRPYAVIATLSIAGFLVMQYIFDNEKPPIFKRLLISIFIFIALTFSIFSGYILFFCYIYHTIVSRKFLLWKHLKYYCLGIIPAIPICYWSIFSGSNLGTGFTSVTHTFAYIHKGVIPILKGVFGNLTGKRIFYILLPIIPISCIFMRKQRIFLFIIIIIPIALLLLACVIFKYWFIQRLFIWAIPLFAFYLGWCWDLAVRKKTK